MIIQIDMEVNGVVVDTVEVYNRIPVFNQEYQSAYLVDEITNKRVARLSVEWID